MVCSSPSTAAIIGAVFDDIDAIQERLRRAPDPVPPPPSELPHATPAHAEPVPPPSRWTLRIVRTNLPQLASYSLSGVWRILQRCHLRLRSAALRQFSPDEHYLDKQAHLLACLRELEQSDGRVRLVFLDEMSYRRWPEVGQTWSERAPAARPVSKPAGSNNQQWRIVGALDALTGQVTYQDGYIVGRRQLIEFYGKLEQVYGACERLYVVQDNWSVHKHEDVLKALDNRPRLLPVWLPTYAPWLNPIEKLWRWLRMDVLRLHELAEDWPGMRRRVRTWLDQFAGGSHALLRYVGLRGEGKLAQALKGR